jgi:alpha-1,2-mannosyltransferase
MRLGAVDAILEPVRDGRWLTLARMRGYAMILLAAYTVFLIGLLATSNGMVDSVGRPLGTDFANVWSSGRMVLDGTPEAPFDPMIQKPYQQGLIGSGEAHFYGWHYPPMFLAVAALLALLPYLPALVVWLFATAPLYVMAVRKIFPVAHSEASLLLMVTLAYPAVFANITHGHNGFLTAALCGGGLALLPTRPLAAGVLFGLLAYKPQYGLLIPLALVLAGEWRAIAAAAATVVATVLASIGLFGVKSWAAFFTHAAFTKEAILEQGAAGWFKLQGVFPAVRMYGGSISTAYTAQLIAMVTVVAAVIWLWRSPANHAQKSAGLILATMLATPYAFNYDTVVIGVAIAFLVKDGCERGFGLYEKSALALLWITPLFSRELTNLTLIPIALVVQVLVFVMLIEKVRRAFVQNRNLSHAI